MSKKNVILPGLAVYGCLVLAAAAFAGGAAPGTAVDGLVALTAPPEGWIALEPPRAVAGHQLFTVINGGAELYVQLGFVRAVFTAYRSPAGKDINLEVYQMKTAAAARQVQNLKAGEAGRAADFGEAGRLGDYYLNFFKGSYQVTVSGYDTDSRTIAGILAIAGRIDKRLELRPRQNAK